MREQKRIQVGTVLEVEIVDIAFGGEGVARHKGRVIFVPYVLVGERALVQVTQDRKNFYRGIVLELLETSSAREKPHCAYFGVCGGCNYQHMSYAEELRVKEKQLRDVLQKIGGIENPRIRPFIRGESAYGYRNRISVHTQRGKIGYHGKDSRDVIDIDQCAIASKEVNLKLTELRQRRGSMREHYSLRATDIPHAAFFQANRFLLEPLRKLVREAVDHRLRSIVEGYAGVGFFSEVIEQEVEFIISIESDKRAVDEAQKSLSSRTRLIEGDFADHLKRAYEWCEAEPVGLLIDPPREGLSKDVVDQISTLDFEQIIYLSCNPSTLARDLKRLSPKWKADAFQPVDMFPRTAHIECLAVLVRS
ncbi:MAG: TRAM domain-containing protein [Verrucomicrobiota bacterium]